VFEKGLPGYDSWLDNYGNPGMGEDEVEYDWAVTDPKVIVTKISDIEFLIRRYNSPDQFTITIDPISKTVRYLFDGEYVYTERFVQFVGLLDEFLEQEEQTAIIGNSDDR
jgi:hypothetical protein